MLLAFLAFFVDGLLAFLLLVYVLLAFFKIFLTVVVEVLLGFPRKIFLTLAFAFGLVRRCALDLTFEEQARDEELVLDELAEELLLDELELDLELGLQCWRSPI